MALLIMTACSGKNPAGQDPDNTRQEANPVGVCIEEAADRQGRTCTEYYSAAQSLNARDIEESCKSLNIQYAKLCPLGRPVVSCEVTQVSYKAIYRFFFPMDQKATWLQRCQQLGGRAL